MITLAVAVFGCALSLGTPAPTSATRRSAQVQSPAGCLQSNYSPDDRFVCESGR
jgi:hypothetical protein